MAGETLSQAGAWALLSLALGFSTILKYNPEEGVTLKITYNGFCVKSAPYEVNYSINYENQKIHLNILSVELTKRNYQFLLSAVDISLTF